MRKMYLMTAVVLLLTIWAAAQQGKPLASQTTGSNATQAQSGSPEGSAPASKGETTIEGCLTESGSSFILTDKSGKAYQLEGDGSKLSNHVGHEVKLVGTESGGGPNEHTTFTVKKLNMMASNCSSK